MKFSKSVIEKVKEVSLIEVVEHFTTVKRNGNTYMAICPFHEEKTGSLSVHSQKGYHCFGCGTSGGDAISFVRKLKNIGFVEAVKIIAEIANIPIEYNGSIPKIRKSVSWQEPKKVFKEKEPTSYIDKLVLDNSTSSYTTNNFLVYLSNLFGKDIANELKNKYHIGGSNFIFRKPELKDYKSDAGATVFWQIDVSKNIRTGKIMLYDKITGRRIKEPFNHVFWEHKNAKYSNYNLEQCLFGEHLITEYPNKRVAIVESEKTAIISSVYFPSLNWIATGGLSNINPDKFEILNGKDVFLFPDNGAYEIWKSKLNVLGKKSRLIISKVLENEAIVPKSDLADYLIEYPLSEFPMTDEIF